MSAPLVSIITPAYRAAATIAETVRSVQAQTWPHWQMLIADDRSPDNTADVVADLARAEPRVTLIRKEDNSGPADTRNVALSRAEGDYVAFLDADDLWLPEKLEIQIRHMQRHDTPLTYTGFRRITADNGMSGRYIGVPPRMTYRSLLKNTAIATSTVVIDRRRCPSLRMKDCYYDDFACWLDVLRDGAVAHGIDQDLMRYRVMDKSVSRNKLHSAWQTFRIYRDVEHLHLPHALWCFAHWGFNALRKYRRF